MKTTITYIILRENAKKYILKIQIPKFWTFPDFRSFKNLKLKNLAYFCQPCIECGSRPLKSDHVRHVWSPLYVVPSTGVCRCPLSPPIKQHLNRFIRFCTVQLEVDDGFVACRYSAVSRSPVSFGSFQPGFPVVLVVCKLPVDRRRRTGMSFLRREGSARRATSRAGEPACRFSGAGQPAAVSLA